jgi:hypothetical protein
MSISKIRKDAADAQQKAVADLSSVFAGKMAMARSGNTGDDINANNLKVARSSTQWTERV